MGAWGRAAIEYCPTIASPAHAHLINLDQRQVIAGLQAIYQPVQQLLRFVHLRFGSATGDVDSHYVGVSLNRGLATNGITAATSSDER